MRLVYSTLFSLLLFACFSSCNKEKSFEVDAPARGSLKNDGTGDCLPKTAVGAFVAGTALTDSNYLEIDVEVASAGSYSIRTDTINGYSFSGIGNFDRTGTNRIRLAASGTPSIAGENRFSVIYDTSFCLVPVTVLPAGSNGGPAAFTLQGSGDTCMIASVAGNYVQNTPLSASNTVAIKVNVTTTGTYTVTTDTVNEFQFSGSGTLAAPGEQTIVLTATGTPATEGATEFTVTAGSTTCTFIVNVTPSTGPPPVTSNDYFPLAPNNYWTYADDTGDPEDSTVITDKGVVTIPGLANPYHFFEIADGDRTPFDTTVYRKSGNDYYTYIPVDQFTTVTFNDLQFGEVLFLKQNLQTGDTWTSAEFSGMQDTTHVKIRYSFTCTDAAAAVPLNGVTYTNVYKITCTPETSLSGLAFANAGESLESYYAKGVGLIFEKGSLSGTPLFQSSLLHYKTF